MTELANDVLTSAYCVTYGFTSETDDCINEPTMIQDSALITEDIVKMFEENPDVNLLTFSTGDANNKLTRLTIQLTNLDPAYSDIFVTQLTNNSNGLYTGEVHEVDSGKFISITTGSSELEDTQNIRLQQWINKVFSVVETTAVTTRNFIPDNRKQYEIMNSQIEELEAAVKVLTSTIETGEQQFTEQAQSDLALQKLTESIATDMLSKISQSTAVRDITTSSSSATTIIEENITPSFESILSSNISNFETVNNNIIDLMDKLAVNDSDTVKALILTEITNLKDIPQDILDIYTTDIMSGVDSFPFTSIDAIKTQVLGIGDELSGGAFGDALDFIANPDGEILRNASNVMEEFGITAAKSAIEDMFNPGNLSKLVEGYSEDAIAKAKDQLPIDDVTAVIDNIKSLKQYTDIMAPGGSGSGIGDSVDKYSEMVLDKGLEVSGIGDVVTGVKGRITDMGKILDNAESGVTDVIDTIKSLGEIGPTIKAQIDTITDYASKASTFLNGFMVAGKNYINTEITKIVDMSLLLREAAAAVEQLCGSGSGAACLLSYGLKGMGLV